jgi:hypothetical protein
VPDQGHDSGQQAASEPVGRKEANKRRERFEIRTMPRSHFKEPLKSKTIIKFSSKIHKN